MYRDLRKNEVQPHGGGGFHGMGFLTLILSILIVLGGVMRIMDNKRQIGILDKEIAKLQTSIESGNPLIKNKQVYLESLKSSKVADYARKRKMVSPKPGQICVVNEQDYNMRDLMLAERPDTEDGKKEVAYITGKTIR